LWLDNWVAACLVPLAAWILLSGLDDLFISIALILSGRKRFPWPVASELDRTPERRIAILVPLWHEDGVIERMLERNLAAIRYRNYDIFAGVYPNDEPTVDAVYQTARRHPRVHIAMCSRDGPTSKGDCLNHAYRRMNEYEAAHGFRFEIVMMHDAEDLVHPESLRLVNHFSREYEMVQIPVLPLPTAWWEFTHGNYCDEFAESQSKDIPVRQRLHGFLPSSGVGTGFDRNALDRLGQERGGLIFNPESLTEDYEAGLCLHAMGCRQVFLPIRMEEAGPVATREYFPNSFRTAIRQRSRWVAGIALQGWERHGWRAPWRQCYWLWRDRKGLAGNLLSPAANLLFLYGCASYAAAAWNGRPWGLGSQIPPPLAAVYSVTFSISFIQMALKIRWSARVYGWRFAAGVPLRMPWANLVNCAATAAALAQFADARFKRRALVWRKTEHVYPASTLPGYSPATFSQQA
jgi:adsorption protein B